MKCNPPRPLGALGFLVGYDQEDDPPGGPCLHSSPKCAWEEQNGDAEGSLLFPFLSGAGSAGQPCPVASRFGKQLFLSKRHWGWINKKLPFPPVFADLYNVKSQAEPLYHWLKCLDPYDTREPLNLTPPHVSGSAFEARDGHAAASLRAKLCSPWGCVCGCWCWVWECVCVQHLWAHFIPNLDLVCPTILMQTGHMVCLHISKHSGAQTLGLLPWSWPSPCWGTWIYS